LEPVETADLRVNPGVSPRAVHLREERLQAMEVAARHRVMEEAEERADHPRATVEVEELADHHRATVAVEELADHHRVTVEVAPLVVSEA
jgi:hypothetical protein